MMPQRHAHYVHIRFNKKCDRRVSEFSQDIGCDMSSLKYNAGHIRYMCYPCASQDLYKYTVTHIGPK